MIHSRVRRFALPGGLLAVVLATALVAASCGSAQTFNDAATVQYRGSTIHIPRDEFQRELRQLTGSEKFRSAYAQQAGTSLQGGSSTNADFSALWLSIRIERAAVDQLFAERHLKITDNDRSQAETSAEQSYFGKDVFDSLPKSLRDTLVDREATLVALLTRYSKTPTDAEAEQYYNEHKSEFGCASGKNVAHILVSDQAKAQSIVDQLKAGASFADLAKANSVDTGSAQQGGDLGCLASGEFVQEFQTAADAAPLNTPVGPVKSQYGYHVILVTPYVSTFEKARSQVVQALEQNAQQVASQAVTKRLGQMKVHVDPRYGTWGVVTNSQGQRAYQVTPPKAPDVRNSRGTTTTPSTAAPTTLAPSTGGSP